MLIQNRTIEKWIQATPNYWHFSNLPYTIMLRTSTPMEEAMQFSWYFL